METLNKNTGNDLQELLYFTGELYDIYKKLENLDYEQKENSDEYHNLILRVQQILQITGTIESRLGTNTSELKSVIKNLDELLGIKYDPNEIDSLMSYGAPKEQMVRMRIVNNLNKLYSKLADVGEIASVSEIDLSEDSIDEVKKISKFRRFSGALVNNNIDRMILSKIEKEGFFSHPVLGRHFYGIKYDLSFLNAEIENELLDNGFKVNCNPYIVKTGINRLFGISKEYNDAFNAQILDSIIASNLEMLCKDDFEICQNLFLAAESITFSYSILSSLVLSDDERFVSETIATIKRIINKIGEAKGFTIVKNLLEAIIDDYEDTKSNYQFISFGGRL